MTCADIAYAAATTACHPDNHIIPWGLANPATLACDFHVELINLLFAGHTLRLLQFPTTLDKGLEKLISLKESFGGLASQMTRMLGAPGTEDIADQLLGKVDQLKVG